MEFKDSDFCHISLFSQDRDATEKFFKALYSWDFMAMPGQNFLYHSNGPWKVCSSLYGGNDGKHATAVPYLVAHDLAATKAKVVELGGEVSQDVTEVPHAGKYIHVKLPGSVEVGFWECAPKDESKASGKRSAEEGTDSVKRVCTDAAVSGKSEMLSLIVDDQTKGLEWYSQKLNFKVEGDHDLGGDFGRWITLHGPCESKGGFKLTLMLAKTDADKALVGKQGGSFPLLTVVTDNIARDAPILKERGVEFVQEPTDRFYGIESLIKDCFGNVINYIQLKPH